MKFPFSSGVLRLLFPVLMGTAGLLNTSCKKDEEQVVKDYSKIDDDIIKKYLDDHQITTAQRQTSGLYYLPVLTDTRLVQASAGKKVSVLYSGHYMDGTVFDASILHGNTPITFTLGTGQVIAGWDEGIALMHKGEKAELFIPSALAYGSRGSGPIPPNTTLRFEVELVDVK
ncbi:FKBP-type peptidyl-prolyl cis-trans isomerase [Hymenobacter ruricola]|uniref:Peptidyl-prolyl cis-trans isomerase n=1 Tax=Hymenobacter ruricola TaxID=2791023 RepID=A0ABS0I1F5_9BACT|nr:FKBP-type peptidyl-prolyl cis-trans isomerase [Hymenobacter ruricola]MBF9220409.1 FKBP-type peptidyl-prolyl cis-trans isomerase [Hymenobacter ruricola]